MIIRKLIKADAVALLACQQFGLLESPEAFAVSYDEVVGTPVTAIESELIDPNIHHLGAFIDGQLVGFMRFIREHRRSRRHTSESSIHSLHEFVSLTRALS